MSDVQFSSGLPETVLDPEPADALAALSEAGDDRDAVASVATRWPRFLAAWARLGDLADDPAFAYACYRVGYHRGLDRLRQNGWRGSGYVRGAHEENRGFLAALAGLGRVAAEIGEADEAERCQLFLAQLDPDFGRG
jgi:hypothetical protein